MFPQVWEVIPDLAHLNTLLDGDIIEEGMVRRKKGSNRSKEIKGQWDKNQKKEKGHKIE